MGQGSRGSRGSRGSKGSRAEEREAAKDYWRKSAPIRPCYTKLMPQTEIVLSVVERYRERIESVLEFGAGTGRNLYHIQREHPDLILHGIDVSPRMVEIGERYGNFVQLGDESLIPKRPSYDLVYTCSVLDHIPEPFPVLEKLVGASRDIVALLEPYTGQEGEVESLKDYTYSWNYRRMLSRLGVKVLQIRKTPLSELGMGPHYWLHVCEVREAEK